MSDDAADPAMIRAVMLFDRSGKSLDWLGQAMGYKGDVARKSAWQFLNKTTDPRLSMLRRFAKAMGVPITELVAETETTAGETEGKRKKARRPT